MLSTLTIASIVEPILDRTPASPTLQSLLAMRASDPAAAQELARLLGGSQLVTQRIRVAYDVSMSGNPVQARPKYNSSRDAIEQSGYGTIHAAAVACFVIDDLALARTWPRYGAFWGWTYAHGLMAAVLAAEGVTHRDISFPATFLRNVGHLLIELASPGIHEHLRARVSSGASVGEAERASLGFTHLDVMSEIAGAWGLDERVARIFDELPERGSIGRVFWKAKRSLHREGVRDPFDPLDLPRQLDPVLHAYIESTGGIRALVSGSTALLACAFVSDSVAEEFPIDAVVPPR